MTYPDLPEIPYPFPPDREPPRRTTPLLVPIVGIPEGDADRRLLDRRTVMVTGPVDHDAATSLCAQLMALDGESAGDVNLVINSVGGGTAEIAAVLDVIELMRASVRTTCIGTARGTAGIVLACGTGLRRAAPNATVSVRCSRWAPAGVHNADLARAAEEADRLRRRLEQALSSATGRPADTVATELAEGQVHGAAEALALGLIDEIARPRRPA